MRKSTKVLLLALVVLALAGGGIVAVVLARRPSEEQKHALYWAIREGDVEKIRTLVREKPALVDSPYKGNTPLQNACCIYSPVDNRNAIVKFLLEEGADPNANGPVCLNGAIYSSDPECIRLLLDHGADPLLKGADGKTALDMAKYYDVKPIPEMIQAHIDKKGK